MLGSRFEAAQRMGPCGVVDGHRTGRSTWSTALMTLLGAVLLWGCVPAIAAAATYYVCNDSSCPKASNANSGEQEEFPWKTIERANEQSLKPGDAVLLKGGDTFKEHELWPASSGSEGKPVVYGSYGTGHAILKMEVWIPPNRSWITIENLTVDGSEHGGATYEGIDGVAGSAEGHDEHISILNNTLEHLAIGVNGEAPETAFTSDNHWLIAGNTVNHTGDSGIYVKGDTFTIEHNTIENTGLDEDKHVKEHGIYMRATNSSVLSNTISHFFDDGVSVRYRNSRVENNTISYGSEGIAWFQYDFVAGTSTWSNNTISHVTAAAFYVSPENEGLKTKESFVITNNVMSEAGAYMDLKSTTGSYTVTGNTPCNVTSAPGNCSFKPKSSSTPYVTTSSATGVTSAAAQLNGVLNPESTETSYHFEYGTTTSYGTKIPVPDAKVGSGESNQEVGQTISGLSSSTTYHYRLVATNSIGNTEGEDHTFTTPLGWSIQSTPNPSEATHSVLSGVSCISSSACTAVGGSYKEGVFFERTNEVALAEAWNGSSWSIQSVPKPTGAKGPALNGVSCTSASACSVVGSYVNGSGVEETLAEVWNGTSWSIQSTPNPTEATRSVLRGVSCTSSSACIAVGGSYKEGHGFFGEGASEVTLAEVWNGMSWSIQSTPNPSGTTISVLDGVSCTSASACSAVGSYVDSSGVEVTLAERWNGSSWSIQSTPNPTEAKGNVLRGVSCTSSSACVAVGSDYTGGFPSTAYSTLAEVWNGTSWSIQSTPNPTGEKGIVLSGVSCTSSSACTAVGDYVNSSGNEVTLAEVWNGTSWAIQSTSNPSESKATALSGVSCTSAILCTAAGDYSHVVELLNTVSTLAESYH
jgi:hypothetical protein